MHLTILLISTPLIQVNTANEQGLTALMVACLREDVAVVRMLIETGAGIDVRNPGWLIFPHHQHSGGGLFTF